MVSKIVNKEELDGLLLDLKNTRTSILLLKKKKGLNLEEKEELQNFLLRINGDIQIVVNKKIPEGDGNKSQTLESIGDILGVSRERVRQIEATGLKKLLTPKTGRALRPYLGMNMFNRGGQ